MEATIRIYDKSLMFKIENINYKILENNLEIYCPNLLKEKMIELKTTKFKKNENEILYFLEGEVIITGDEAVKMYIGKIIFDEDKECIVVENFKIKELVNLGCFSFITRIKL